MKSTVDDGRPMPSPALGRIVVLSGLAFATLVFSQSTERLGKVMLEPASAQTLKELRANTTGKLLMVNFWATWCGPCVSEFPELLETYRLFQSRGLEFVTVSVDVPDARPAVLKFLREQHSSARNFQFASDDFYTMQAAFDPDWESGVPFTIVIAPNGKAVFRQEGEVDLPLLRRAILANLTRR